MVRRSYPLPIPLLGIQLRGKHNPHLIALSQDNLVDVEVEVEEAEKPVVHVEGEPSLGWRGELALKSFVDVVCERLETNLEFRVGYRAKVFHVAGVYAVITYAIVEAVAEEGGYEMEPIEVAEAANSIDEDAGVALDYIDGCRVALAKGTSLVYRRGEEPIPVKLGGSIEVCDEQELGKSIEDELDEDIHTVVSRLTGISVVTWVRALRERGWAAFLELFEQVSRVENSIYYMLFGVEPPEEGCKWTPGLQTVQAVCVHKGVCPSVALR